jgi:hypothetical protein
MERKDSDIILSKEWYEYYVECHNNLKRIKKILSNDIIYIELYKLVGESKIWSEMTDIYDNTTIKNPKEIKEIHDTSK